MGAHFPHIKISNITPLDSHRVTGSMKIAGLSPLDENIKDNQIIVRSVSYFSSLADVVFTFEEHNDYS